MEVMKDSKRDQRFLEAQIVNRLASLTDFYVNFIHSFSCSRSQKDIFSLLVSTVNLKPIFSKQKSTSKQVKPFIIFHIQFIVWGNRTAKIFSHYSIKMIRQLALKIGAYFDSHCCKYCILRISIIVTSLISLAWQIHLTLSSSKHPHDYRIYNDHYLVRVPSSQFRGLPHLSQCCQYFRFLDHKDVDAINNPSKLPEVIIYFLVFFGCVVCSVWGNIVKLMGRYGLHATVTVSGMLIGQFSISKSIVKYGQQCIKCSHLDYLLVKPDWYPMIGVVIFVLGLSMLTIYFKYKKLKKNGLVYTLWCLGVTVTMILWAWANLLIIMNSSLGYVLFANTLMDFLALSVAYYRFDKSRSRHRRVMRKISHFFEWINPFSDHQ